MNLNTVSAVLEGVSPILMNPATDRLLEELYGGAGARKPKDPAETPEQAAAKKVIRNGGNEVGLPAEYLFGCLVEAGRMVKIDGRRNISTKESTLIPSFLTIEEHFFPFLDQNEKWVIDMRRGRLPKDGTAVCIVRPRFDKWAFAATLTIDTDEIAEDKVKMLVTKAGTSVGLGDFRPACRGYFGRFKIAKWETNGHEQNNLS